MSKNLKSEKAELLAIINEGPISNTKIQARLSFEITTRALGYRLKLLREEGVIESSGRGRGTTYRASSTADVPKGYERSRLDAYTPNTTFLLSEANRKRFHELGKTAASAAPAGTFARNILERFLIDLSWASSSLEGNTYSLLETASLLRAGEVAEGKNQLETQMILNHKSAIEYLVDSAEEIRFSRHMVFNLHALLMDNLFRSPGSLGAIREIPVGISGSRYIPLANPHTLEEMYDRILAVARAIEDPFEAGVFAMLHLSYLQPFLDGNKRTARMMLNFRLIKENLKPFSFVDVDREEYLHATLLWYEDGNHEPLVSLLMRAYETSAVRYEIVYEAIEPDVFKMLHRKLIQRAVHEVVTDLISDPELFLDQRAKIAFEEGSDRGKFVAGVLAELRGLHEGNFARFKLRPSEFEKWWEAQE